MEIMLHSFFVLSLPSHLMENFFTTMFNFIEFIFVYVANIRFICDGQIYFLTFTEYFFLRNLFSKKFPWTCLVWNVCLRMVTDTTTPHRKRSHFLTLLEILCFCGVFDYIFNQITCNTNGKVARKIGEIGLWRWFSYFVFFGVNSKISLQNVRTIIVNGYSDWFGFL